MVLEIPDIFFFLKNDRCWTRAKPMKKMRVPPWGLSIYSNLSLLSAYKWAFFLVGFCPVGFCPSGLLSQWAFVQWAFVLVGFCPSGLCPSGLLSSGFMSSWAFVLVVFCPALANTTFNFELELKSLLLACHCAVKSALLACCHAHKVPFFF